MNKKAFSLKSKQTFYILVGQLISVALFTLALGWNNQYGLNQLQDALNERKIAALSYATQTHLRAPEQSLDDLKQFIALQAERTKLTIYKSDGNMLLSYQAEGYHALADNISHRIAFVDEQSQPLGSLELWIMPLDIRNWLVRTLGIFAFILLITAAVAPLIANLVSNLTTKRIRQIIQLTDEISSKSNFKQRLEDRNKDEIGQLSRNINAMLEAAEGREAQLTSYGSYLEDLVKEKSSQLQAQTNIDALTRCPNRINLMSQGDELIHLAQEQGFISSLIVIDLLRIKTYNQSLGHQIGDSIIKTVAERLRESFHQVYRIGGDEYAVLVSHPHLNSVTADASKILELVRQPIRIGEHNILIEAAAGVSYSPDHGLDIATLLRCANAAMQQSKSLGSSVLCEYHPDQTPINSRQFDIERDLPNAIANDELYLLYQPKQNIRKKTIEGVEALARWQHPSLGAISPLEFVQIAESTGQARALGLCVLRQAIQQLKTWSNDGIELPIAVNISPSHLMHPDFVVELVELIERHQIDASLLELEITESLLIDDLSYTSNTIDQIRELGIKIAIDDFGTGYSSLSYLRKFSVDTLKLDASFISDLEHSAESTGIVDAVILLAHSIGLEVVAEGVESQEQLFVLNSLNCDYIQGSLISMPISAEQVEAMAISMNTNALRSLEI